MRQPIKRNCLFFLVVTCAVAFLTGCKKEVRHFTLDAPELYFAEKSAVVGNPQGSLTIVEFFDYSCHACKRAFPALHTLIDIDPQVRLIYRNLPILGPVSEYAARASLASQYQGKFKAFHTALMTAPSLQSSQTVLNIAKKVGINVEKLQEDMKQSDITHQIEDNYATATTLNIVGTPAFLFANTSWHDGQLAASGAILSRGAMSLTAFKKMIVSVKLNDSTV